MTPQDNANVPALKLNWSVEFDEAAGARPSASFFGNDIGDGVAAGIPGWGNSEREWYEADAATTDGSGNLVIRAERTKPETDSEAAAREAYYGGPAEWTSAKLTTLDRLHFRYGRVEARVKAPSGSGTWPAFWMLGTDIREVPWPACGEIDIFEGRGDFQRRVYGTLHGPGYAGEHGRGLIFEAPEDNDSGFHTFAIDWLPGQICWSYDGQVFQTLSAKDLEPNEWVFDHDFYLILNLAMGGHFTGPIDPSLNEAEFVIDYIRHYSIDGVGETKLLV
jgi:beta-glucanase (GH16 family)